MRWGENETGGTRVTNVDKLSGLDGPHEDLKDIGPPCTHHLPLLPFQCHTRELNRGSIGCRENSKVPIPGVGGWWVGSWWGGGLVGGKLVGWGVGGWEVGG